MTMTKFYSLLTAVAAAAAAVSCSPQTYSFAVQMRYPSDSGLDIGDKSVAVVYLTDGLVRDSLINDGISDGLAQGLESDFRSSGYSTEVEIYKITDSGDYGSKDSLVSLVMRTDADVVILLDRPECDVWPGGMLPCISRVWAYDSMSPVDTVWTVCDTAYLSSPTLGESMMLSDAQRLGYTLSSSLVNKWRGETYSLIYYDNLDDRWTDAADKALSMQWDEAMSVWMEMLEDTSDTAKRSCLSYDMALGCYMTGEYALALQWLDASDSLYPVSLSQNLRERVKARL